jgi:hypothetical protein
MRQSLCTDVWNSGLLHNEIADTLATRQVKGTTYCPTNRFDVLPADTEPEDVLEMHGVVPVIRQTEEYDEDVDLPPFSTGAIGYGFGEEEARDQAEATFNRFSRDVLGNSGAQVSDDSDVSQGQDTIIVTSDMTIVQEEPKTFDQCGRSGENAVDEDGQVHMTVISPGIVDSPGIAPHAGSTSFAQARSEAIQQRAMEEQYSWMTEADQHMFQLGLEPVPWEHFAEAVEQKGKGQFQAIEQRASEEQVMQSSEPPTPNSLVGVTMVVRSETMISAFREVSPITEAEGATTDLLSKVVKALPKGAMLDLIGETTAMY